MTFAKKVEFYFSNFQANMKSTYKNKNTITIYENCNIKFVRYCYENNNDQTLTFNTLNIEHINNYFEWIDEIYRNKQEKNTIKRSKIYQAAQKRFIY